MINQFLFLDTETTGLDDEDRIVEIAFKWYEGKTFDEGPDKFKGNVCEFRCKAPIPVKVGAMSISHIRNDDLKNLKSFKEEEKGHLGPKTIQDLLENRVIVAHNAEFDVNMLRKEGFEINDYICTKKLAHYVFPELDRHNMQYLRYYLWENNRADMSLPDGMQPHQALADIYILERLFYQVVKEFNEKAGEFNVQKAVDISKNPVLLYKYAFGKYRESPITYEQLVKADPDYCDWIITKSDMSEDVKYTVSYYLNKLRNGR